MKAIFVLAGALALGGCGEIGGMSAGNPDGMAYAGSAGSVYSAPANPPQTIGRVTYNPDTAPLPASDLPTPAPSPIAPGYPAPPLSGTPMRHS